MRISALLLLITPFAVHAATPDLSVTVASGQSMSVSYSYALDGERHQLDLREGGRYHVAFNDKASKKDICREAEYKTGLLLTIRSLAPLEDKQRVEVVGQVSELSDLKDGAQLSCGINQEPVLEHRGFSDTVVVEPNRTKVIVLDGKHTVMLKIQ